MFSQLATVGHQPEHGGREAEEENSEWNETVVRGKHLYCRHPKILGQSKILYWLVGCPHFREIVKVGHAMLWKRSWAWSLRGCTPNIYLHARDLANIIHSLRHIEPWPLWWMPSLWRGGCLMLCTTWTPPWGFDTQLHNKAENLLLIQWAAIEFDIIGLKGVYF